MVSTLRALRIDNLLCVGAPRLFDFMTACKRKSQGNPLAIKTFLLDLDVRLVSCHALPKHNVIQNLGKVLPHFLVHSFQRTQWILFQPGRGELCKRLSQLLPWPNGDFCRSSLWSTDGTPCKHFEQTEIRNNI